MRGFSGVKAYVEGKGIVTTNIGWDNGRTKLGCEVENIAEFGSDVLVVPGFVDQHIHGAAGFDAMDGTYEALHGIATAIASEGTTAFLATTMTQSPDNIRRALANVGAYREKGVTEGAEVLGVHLEGPFISTKHVGAQPIEYVAAPDISVFADYWEASKHSIRLVSMAPEVEGAEAFIADLVSRGVVVSIGHTDATYADVARAVEAGARNVTHTYNAQRGLHHREAGTVGAAFLLDELNCELICDTIHVSVPAMRLVLKNKPADKLTLITDAMRAKHMPDGESELGGQLVIVKNGEARLADGTLAGSVLKMNAAVKNLHERVGASLEQAIDCASLNPAKNLGIDADYGSIRDGKLANFAVLDSSFGVLMTVRNGEVIYRK